MKALAETIGENIRAHREAMGMSVADLTRAICDIDPKHSAIIWRWETAKNSPNAYYLCILADVFGCSVDELLGRG